MESKKRKKKLTSRVREMESKKKKKKVNIEGLRDGK